MPKEQVRRARMTVRSKGKDVKEQTRKVLMRIRALYRRCHANTQLCILSGFTRRLLTFFVASSFGMVSLI